MFSGITLVPVNDIDSAWDIVKNYYNVENGLVDRLIKYIEDNWLNNNRSLYRREIRKLNKLINKNNAGFLEVFHYLKECLILSNIEFRRLINSGKNKPRKRVYIEQDNEIYRLWNSYNNNLISLEELLV
ncbi:hypothetical protein G9O61_00g016780 [Vairimorpha ceranae]|nr:hypothetical protein G9O61_00g016780 [Vairimorpha ceranae]